MNSSLDLNLWLVTRQGGLEPSELPDVYAVSPPRRSVRERESDSLIIYFSMTGNFPLAPGAQSQLLEQLSQKFYKTSGSLTAALRSLAESVNLQLLDRNLRSTSSGKQGIGQLQLVALRGDTLYIAQSGAVQAYLVAATHTQPLYDLETTGRGLGLSRSTPLRFLQVKPALDEYLVLATIPAPDWSEASLSYPTAGGIENLRQQLTANMSLEFNSIIIQARPGTGKMLLARRTPGLETPPENKILATSSAAAATTELSEQPNVSPAEGQPIIAAAPSASAVPTAPVDIPAQPETSPREPTDLPISTALVAAGIATATDGKPESVSPTAQLPAPPSAAEVKVSQPEAPAAGAVPASTVAATPKPASQPQKSKPSAPRPWAGPLAKLGASLALFGEAVLHSMRKVFSVIGIFLMHLLKNLLPDADVLRLPQSTMIFIAIAVPLILAVVGGMVFLQRGQAKQHEIYYQQAVEKAAYAASLTNPLEQRLALQTALGELDKAEEYLVTSQSQALRAEVTSSLDALDAVRRLDYQPAIISGLASGVNVTRIIATAADLYLLNATDGSVLHAVLTTRGYEMDPTFQCGPTSGPITVGPLVDIAELPPGAYENASVLGMDANGNLLYCVIGSQPYSATLAPPNTGLGQPVGMSLDRNDLYVLDPSVNAVWIYRNLEVSQPPRLFFGDEVPPMQDVIDLEVYNDDLYMLHSDGHTTKCTYSAMAESPTQCVDPYPYSDNRPGRIHGPVVEDTAFSQIDYISFPERSIFFLDPPHQAIYYFSVLLTLQHQYQPITKLAEGDATAFSISANRIAFLAIGDNVYYAAIP